MINKLISLARLELHVQEEAFAVTSGSDDLYSLVSKTTNMDDLL